MIFTHQFEISLEDINKNFHITNKAILKFFENIAALYSNNVKKDDNLTWVLVEWDLQVLKRAKYGEMVDVKVWTKNITGKYPYLDFEMYVGKTKVAIATSKWALIDLKARQFAEVTKEYLTKYSPESKETIPVASLKRINVPETFDKCVEVAIRKSDIDFNGHIHNLNYLDFIAELMDFDENYDNLRIIYWKEIRYGNTVTVCKATIDNSLYFIIKSGEEVKTIIEAK